jgi:hypothetical protein
MGAVLQPYVASKDGITVTAVLLLERSDLGRGVHMSSRLGWQRHGVRNCNADLWRYALVEFNPSTTG